MRGALARAEEPEVEVVRTDGVRVFDAKGRGYVDFVSSWLVGNLGWGDRAIRERLRSFDGPDYVAPRFGYAPWDELARRLVAVAPPGLAVCHRATGGTEAVDVALQIAAAATGRTAFVAVEGAYHGNSVATRSLVRGGGRRARLRLAGCRTIPAALDADALGELERILERRATAAFVLEPVLCNVGARVPSADFLHEAAALCRRHGTLLVLDEVACGFGRTGRLFAAEHSGVAPDVLCLAKGLTSGYAPMGATLVTADVARAAGRRAYFYSTYGWHPLAVEAALATLDRWEEEGEEILANVRARGRQIEARLRAMGFEAGTDFRGLGLALAVEMRSEDEAAEVVARCRRRGLLVSNDEETLQLLPPLVVDEETVDRAMDVLEDGLGRAGRSRRRTAARRPRSRTVRGSTSRRRPARSGARGPRRPGGARRTAAR